MFWYIQFFLAYYLEVQISNYALKFVSIHLRNMYRQQATKNSKTKWQKCKLDGYWLKIVIGESYLAKPFDSVGVYYSSFRIDLALQSKKPHS